MRFITWFDRLTVFLLVCFLIVLPAVYSFELSEGTQSQKTVVFIYGVSGLFVVYGIRHFLMGRLRFRITAVDVALCAVFVYTVVRRYFSELQNGFSLRYQELIFLALLYLVLRKVSKRYFHVVVLLGVVVSGLVQAVYGMLQLYGYQRSLHAYFSVTGSFFNPAPFAAFIGMTLIVAVAILFALRRPAMVSGFGNIQVRVYIALAWAGAVLTLLLLPVTESRAAWLATAAAAAYLLWEQFGRSLWASWTGGRRVMRSLAAVAFVVVTLALAYGVYGFKRQSAHGRAFIWEVTTSLVRQRPVWGYGYDTFTKYYMAAQASFFEAGTNPARAEVADDVEYVYNEPLEVWLEGGVIGLLLFAALYFLLFRTRSEKHGVPYSVVAKAGLIFYLVCSLFSYPSHILPVKVILVIGFAMLARQHTTVATISFRGAAGVLLRGIALPVVLAIAVLACRHASAVRHAYDLWQDGQELYDMRSYAVAASIYKEAYPVLATEGEFLGNYGKALYMAKQYAESLTILTQCERYLDNSVVQIMLGDVHKALKHYDEAERRYWQAWYRVPGRYYPKFLLAKLYEERGLYRKALDLAEEVVRTRPKIENGATDEIKIELNKIIARSRKRIGLPF